MELEQIRTLILSYVDAFNHQDLDALSALFDDRIQLRDWSLDIVGKAAVLEANRAMFTSTRSLTATVLGLTVEGNRAAMELEVVVDGTGRLRVVDILEFTEAGRLAAIRAYKG